MDLLQDILIKILESNAITVSIPGLESSIAELIELKCYQAIQKIKVVLENNSLDDRECFMRIEEIVLILEDIGTDCGNRHDFG